MIIYPKGKEKFIVVEPCDDESDLFIRKSSENIVSKKIMEQMSMPYHQSLLKMNQCSRHLMKLDYYPSVLLLSNNEGGFARKGLKLVEEDKVKKYSDLNYVDLVLDENSIDNGELFIYTHELAHVIMNNVIENYPEYKSTKQHVSMGITDYLTAFFEGWAIQFESHTYENIDLYKKIIDGGKDYSKTLSNLWHCSVDADLRLQGVKNNIYLRKKGLPSIDIDKLDLKDKILLEHTSTVFDCIKVKNAQELFSSEGFIATLFYRLTSNENLQNRYLDLDFYKNFVSANAVKDCDIRDLFTPFENVLLKCIWLFKKLSVNIHVDSCPMIDFINLWMASFPEDKPDLVDIFLTTTTGRSIENDLVDLFEQVSYYGLIGSADMLVKYGKMYQERFVMIKEEIVSGQLKIDENLGKEIWQETENVLVPTCLWGEEEFKKLSVNINTASHYELKALFSYEDDRIKELIKYRDEVALFDSYDDFLSFNDD